MGTIAASARMKKKGKKQKGRRKKPFRATREVRGRRLRHGRAGRWSDQRRKRNVKNRAFKTHALRKGKREKTG